MDDTCDLAPVEHACDDTGPMVPAAGEVLVSVCDHLYLKVARKMFLKR